MKGDGAALADVLDDGGAEDGEAFALGVAGGRVDQAVAAFREDGGGERLAGGVGDRGIGIEIGGSLFCARIMKAAGEAGDQLAVAADVVKAAGFAERPGAVIDDFRLTGLKRARAEGAIPGAALLAVEAVARRARMAKAALISDQP